MKIRGILDRIVDISEENTFIPSYKSAKTIKVKQEEILLKRGLCFSNAPVKFTLLTGRLHLPK